MTNFVMPNASAGMSAMVTMSGSQALKPPDAAGAAASFSDSGWVRSSAIKNYCFRLFVSCSIWSLVEMTLALAS